MRFAAVDGTLDAGCWIPDQFEYRISKSETMQRKSGDVSCET